MSTNGTTITKIDFIGEIWQISTTLTEEAMAAASAKAKEMGFEPNRGSVHLDESFINLSSARAVLEDAIEKQKLIQLPITVQKELLSCLQLIAKSLRGLTDGVDEVVNLSGAIEALNTAIWKYGLHNLSDEVLGYQKKLNQIKNQELQIRNTMTQLEAAQEAGRKAELAAGDIAQRKTAIDALLEQVKGNGSSSASLLEQIKEVDTKSSALYASIQQNEKQSGELAASIKTANNELLSLDESIRKFYGEVDAYRKKINQTGEDASSLIATAEGSLKKLMEDSGAKVGETIESLKTTATAINDKLDSKVGDCVTESRGLVSKLIADANGEISTMQNGAQEKLQELEGQLNKRSEETIEANGAKTSKLIEELTQLKEQIREQIQQATGFTLFGAFQSRQNQIVGAKNFWVYAITLLVAVSAGVTIWIAHEAQFYSVNHVAFFVKLSITIPLGFAITFCTLQYSRERRLEEEYAFKSSISVSLNPYRDLIHAILEKDGTIDQSKYTDFVIDSVRNVFTPPTDKVFEGEKKSGHTAKALKEAAEIVGAAVKAAK